MEWIIKNNEVDSLTPPFLPKNYLFAQYATYLEAPATIYERRFLELLYLFNDGHGRRYVSLITEDDLKIWYSLIRSCLLS